MPLQMNPIKLRPSARKLQRLEPCWALVMEKCLEVDPAKRITAEDLFFALEHTQPAGESACSPACMYDVLRAWSGGLEGHCQ